MDAFVKIYLSNLVNREEKASGNFDGVFYSTEVNTVLPIEFMTVNAVTDTIMRMSYDAISKAHAYMANQTPDKDTPWTEQWHGDLVQVVITLGMGNYFEPGYVTGDLSFIVQGNDLLRPDAPVKQAANLLFTKYLKVWTKECERQANS